MMTRRLVIAACALLWTSAAYAQAPATPAPSEAADPAIWQGEPAAGAIVHRSSKVALPAELEGFARFRVGALGPDDVAANYQRTEGETKTELTIYLFKPGSLPEHRLKGSVAAIGIRSPTAFVWSSGPFDVPGPTLLHGHKGVYKTGIGPGTLMDYLYFFELGQWTVKLRGTVSGLKDLKQEDRIDSFVRGLPWAQILAANGACAGSACTAPSFEAFDHHYSEAMLAPLLLSKMKFDPRKERDLPVAAKVGIGLFGETEVRRSSEDPLVYVAEVRGMGTYRLVKYPDVASALITETFGKLSIHKPLYAVVFRMGTDNLMPRFFHGEPTPEAFGAAIDELLLHPTANPFVTVKDTAEAMPD
jgi:hypothetical protein